MNGPIRRATARLHWRQSAVAVLLPAALILLLGGCRTQQAAEFSRTQIAGAVYDDLGEPIPGALVRIARRTAVSDTLGRFRVDGVSPGKHSLEVTADKHEPYRASVEVQSRTQFIRVQLPALTTLVDQAIAYLEESAVEAAGEIARRLEEAAPDDRRTHMLRQVVSQAGPPPAEGAP
ncbi:MAG: carboxypeptidase-like regulatory domain-containing protein [Alkalispirochaeta sp.]